MKKILVGTSIGIIIIIIILGTIFNPIREITEELIEIEKIVDKENIIDEDVLIESKIDEIEKNNLENQYIPKPREWISSGPFQIDRSEYILGEKIFMRFGDIEPNEKGQVAIMRPLNNTHYSVYLTIPFDGMSSDEFNYYFQPSLLPSKEICSVNDILGKWAIVFRGTQYSNLNFDIINQTLPGDEKNYDKPVC